MIIVVEGTDGVGKTTLMDAVESLHPGPVHRMKHGPPEDVMPALAYFDAVIEMVERSRGGELVLSDRLHVGELAYGPLLRGSSNLTMDEARIIDMMLYGAGAMMVHCILSGSDLGRRLVSRDGGEPDERSGAALKHSRPLRALFRRLIGQGVGILPGPWQDQDMNTYPSQMAGPLLVQARMRMAASPWVIPSSPYIGDPNADVVLALPRRRCVNVEHLAWIVSTVRDSHDESLRSVAIAAPGCQPPSSEPHTIALGRRAEEWCDEVGWACHGTVKHRVDQHDYDDSGPKWLRRVRKALAASRESETQVLAHQGLER